MTSNMKVVGGVIVSTLFVVIFAKRPSGIYDKVPPLQMIKISLPKKEEWDASKPLKLVFDAFSKNFNVNLQPVQSQETLIGKYTPIWLAKSDNRAPQFVSYSPAPSIISDIGTFTRYHDIKTRSAVTVFYNSSRNSYFINGIVHERYNIQSLPAVIRDYPQTQPGGQLYEVYVVYKLYYVSPSPSYFHHSNENFSTTENATEIFTFSPKILILLQYNSIRYENVNPMYKISSQTPDDELIRFIIQYWNCVDMIFRQIESFKIMLHITGIIIPRDTGTTPYMKFDPNESNDILAYDSTEDLVKFMHDAHDNKRFAYDNEDIALVMFEKKRFCFPTGYLDLEDPCDELRGGVTQCGSTNRCVGFVKYNYQFLGIRMTANLIARTMGVKTDAETGFIMTPNGNAYNNSLLWSNESKRAFRNMYQHRRDYSYNSTTKEDHGPLQHSNYDWISLHK